MAILQEEMVEMSSQSFDKGIDQYAMQMMMDILQKNQYINPQRSAVREIASNAVDAINEREVAKSILTGKSKVEDHYLMRDDGVFRDSMFDPSYYDLKWLSDLKEVHITYYNNGTTERDELVIRDFGVGLWGNRLRGYFNLGYSTKRNARFALGKFGIGAKSALATREPFFTVVTNYNGNRTAFNVYAGKVEPITPKFNLETGATHQHFDMEISPGHFMQVFYEPTTEKNGVSIHLQVKKHHKSQYLDAVRSQLMYFKEVRFYEMTADGTKILHETRAEVLYEDEGMIISNNTFHNRPHLLIDKVNYGNINFEELELNDRKGNIGIKLKSEEVSVNPSRESVIWDDVTKEAILNAFLKVQKAATKRLQKELTSTDILSWYRACQGISAGYRGVDPIVHAMSNIIDMSTLDMAFGPFPKLTWNFPVGDVMETYKVRSKEVSKGSKRYLKLERDRALRYDMFGTLPIVRRHRASDDSVPRKNKYLSRVLYPDGYIDMVIPPLAPEDSSYKYDIDLKSQVDFRVSSKFPKWERSQMTDAEREKYDKERREYQKELYRELHEIADYVIDAFATSENIVDYSAVDVPDSFRVSATEDDVDEVETQGTTDEGFIYTSQEERRKLEGTFLVHLPTVPEYGDATNISRGGVPAACTTLKLEIKPAALDQWEMNDLYYSAKADEELLHMAAIISKPSLTYQHRSSWVRLRPDMHTPDAVHEKLMSAEAAIEKYAPNTRRNGKFLENDITDGYNIDSAPYVYRHLFNNDTRLLMVSEDNAKYFRDFKHIRQFFMDVKNNKLTMSEQLVQWNTARLMRRDLEKLRFLKCFHKFNPELTQWFHEAEALTRTYDTDKYIGRFGNREEFVKDLGNYLDRVGEFQDFVRKNQSDFEAITAMAKGMLNPADGIELTDARAVDFDRYDQFLEILDMVSPVYVMLNDMTSLKGGPMAISAEVEQEIRNYIVSKGAQSLLTYKPDHDDHSESR